MSTEHYPYPRVTINPALWKVMPRSARRVLDLGGGRGGNGAAIKTRCDAEHLVIADRSELALADTAPGVNGVALLDVDQPDALERMWAEHGPFDLVCALDVLEHLYDPWAVVARLHRLLPVNGRIVASIPNVQHVRVALASLTGRWAYEDMGLLDRTHIRFFSRATAEALMSCSGMVVRKRAATFRDRGIAFNRATFGLLSDWLALQHLICVEKTSEAVHDPGFCGSSLLH